MIPGMRRMALGLCCVAAAGPASAAVIQLGLGEGRSLDATLNTTVTVGGAVRTQAQAADLIGKSNLDPQVCTGVNGAYQSCLGLFKNQLYPARRLYAAPGAASINNDDGDLDYGKGELVSAVAKVTQDLTMSRDGFGLFARWLYFYDAVNDDFTEHHPNRITPQNYLGVGRQVPGIAAGTAQTLLQALQNPAALAANPFGLGSLLLNPRPYGRPGPNGTTLVYGPGGAVNSARDGGEERREIGTDLQWLDAYVFGSLPLWDDRTLSFRLGRQTLGWGESTTLVINSINQANPVNVNNLYRVGSQVEELFTPVAMISASFEPVSGYNLQAFYQLEWQPVETPAPGSYFSDVDIGSRNLGKSVSNSNGGVAEDPDGLGSPIDSPLAGLSNTTFTTRRLPDAEPNAAGQFGLALKHDFEDLGNGLDVGVYFMNYHSRLPYASFYAANPSCARKDGNALGIDATGLASFLAACPDIPIIHSLLHPGEPATDATSSAAAFDSARLQFEYPRNIQLYGLSFNTTVGDYALQGEVAYRPNLPLQVALADLAFASLGPTLTSCHDRAVNCTGSAGLADLGIGYAVDGSTVNYGSSDFTPPPGVRAYPDLVNVGIGHVPGSARAFPSFVVPYRGGLVGDNPGCPKGMPDSAYHPGIACYIRGYEREQVYEFNFGTTRVIGASDNPFGASQVTVVSEWGATWVPYLPALDRLQFQAPGVYYHASAGADGSGADGSRQACSTNPACSLGADGLRANPHQQDLSRFPDPFSWGYRVIAILEYASVLPDISLKPMLFWSQDVQGTAPGPGGNFVAGRKQAQLSLEMRYRADLSLNLAYTWFFGAGQYNTLSDRDYAQLYLKYQF